MKKAAEILYLSFWRNSEKCLSLKYIQELENVLSTYFGDRLVYVNPYNLPQRASFNVKDKNKPSVPTMIKTTDKQEVENSKDCAVTNSEEGSDNLNIKPKRELSKAFDLPIGKHNHSKTIHCNFTGANPLPGTELKQRQLVSEQIQFTRPSTYFTKCCEIPADKAVSKKLAKVKKQNLPLNRTTHI